MSPVRARREAAKRLGLALQAKYRALVEATGEDAIQNAAIELGSIFNSNIEFVINVLKDYGGLDAKFEPMTKLSLPAANDPPPPMPAIFSAGADVDLSRKH